MSAIHDLIGQIQDAALRERIAAEVDRIVGEKKFGLVFEDHIPESTPLYGVPARRGATVARRDAKDGELMTVLKVSNGVATCANGDSLLELPVSDLIVVARFGEAIYPYLEPMGTVARGDAAAPWHTLIEADNYHALQFLEYLYAGKVDCIYIDPPYNTGARDWKYNNDYVDGNDAYRHSKWLSMMQRRLRLAKRLLNPKDSVLIVTIDEKEYLHLGCLLEEMFPEARMQMVSSVINTGGVARGKEFARSNEYLFFVMFGVAGPLALPLDREWLGTVKKTTKDKLRWREFRRAGTHNTRAERPNQFYPIFVTENGKRIHSIGASYYGDNWRNDVTAPDGTIAIWPLFPDGKEGCWVYQQEGLKKLIEKGYIKLGRFTSGGMAISYIAAGEQAKVENGDFKVLGRADDGSIIVDETNYQARFVAGTSWSINTHNASEYGSKIINSILGQGQFAFPKSLYAVHDAIRFFVADKPDALIVDFFAGSGTTLHAVNLLNAEDGGRRRCILVTNNEVSEAEAKALKTRGLKPGDEEWEQLGIARHVTWPRTVCSIEGHDVKGAPLKGEYLGSGLKMADGFKANAAFFKLGFLDKSAVSLGRQFREMLPTLWMKAGAHGPCPGETCLAAKDSKEFLILPDNSFAVLMEERAFGEFREALAAAPEAETVYLITDYEQSFKAMSAALKERRTVQLYRDYLDNFRINRGER